MALSASKTIMLEKQYLYVKASKGFQLEGTNIEKIWVNTGYYRFLVDNVAKALSNSYVKIWYDPSDIDFIAYCSDLFMEEIQNTVVVAIENLQSYLVDFYDRNHEDISELSEGLSGALQVIVGTLTSKPVVFAPNDTYSNINLHDYSDSFDFIIRSYGSSSYGKTLSFGNCEAFVNKAVMVVPDGRIFQFYTNVLNDIPYIAGVYKVIKYA